MIMLVDRDKKKFSTEEEKTQEKTKLRRKKN